jgi:DNA-binding CsgD family transcriptional regulator
METIAETKIFEFKESLHVKSEIPEKKSGLDQSMPIYVCTNPHVNGGSELSENIECIVIITKGYRLSQPFSVSPDSIPCEVWLQIQKALFNSSPKPVETGELSEELLLEPNSGLAVLTIREKEIIELLCDGLLYKEIAERLGISALTVKNHLRNIYLKLRVANRSEAIVKYLGLSSTTCHCRQKFKVGTI